MPPPVAIPRDVPAPDLPAGTPVAGHPATEPDGRVPSTSLAHVAALVRAAVPPMHPGGRPIVAGVAAAAGLVRVLTGRGALAGVLATAAVAAFFRNPHRVPPPRTGVVLSPADGTVALVSEVVPPPELDLPRVPAPRVSVFLSVLDVHVQRIPADGRVVDVAVPARPLPVGGPRQGQRGQRAQRAAAGDRRRRPGRRRADRRACWPGGSAATSARATRSRRGRPTD